MSKLKHTLGVWKYEITNSTPDRLDIIIKSDSGDNIGWVYTVPEQGEANARLIATTPKMLEELILFVKRVRAGEVKSKKTYAKFVELIESATGLSIEEVLEE